ncbi:hypothetical protein [Aquisediminimonas profunda]|uniref:hypothetical protein n=1 Tax=Aquisediminimonas profunda TaxID=1550733 RepID=UPI001C636E1C|nr:hypothetical protein [Aquisediminimonas profunda]
MTDHISAPAMRARTSHAVPDPVPDCSDALFAEILLNDRIDLAAGLPMTIGLDFTTTQLELCFRASSRLWHHQLERVALVHMTRTLRKTGDISADDRLRFKHERARFKHLRFAFAIFGVRHRYPPVLDAITSVMGNVQDAFKNERHVSVRRNALLLQALLHAGPVALVAREIDRFRPASPESFRCYLARQANGIAAFLEQDRVTAQSFHDTRKIVSRFRAGFATLKTLYPDPDIASVADFVATINGLMGNYHDDLMSAHLRGHLDYHRDPIILQDDIRHRLQSLALAMH